MVKLRPYEVRGNIPFPWTSQTEGAKLYFQQKLNGTDDLVGYYPVVGAEIVSDVSVGRIGAIIDGNSLPVGVDARIMLLDPDGAVGEPFADLVIGEDGHTVSVRLTEIASLGFHLKGIGTYNDYHRVTVHNNTDTGLVPVTLPYVMHEGDILVISMLPQAIAYAKEPKLLIYDPDNQEAHFYLGEAKSEDNGYTELDEILSDNGQISVIVGSSGEGATLLGAFEGDSVPMYFESIEDGMLVLEGSLHPIIATIGGRPTSGADIRNGIITLPFSPDPCPPLGERFDPGSFNIANLPIKLATQDLPLDPSREYTTFEIPILQTADYSAKAFILGWDNGSTEISQTFEGVIYAGDESPFELTNVNS